MEQRYHPKAKGMTHLKCVQILDDTLDPFLVPSIDLFSNKGVTGRLTGIGNGMEMKVFPYVAEMFPHKNTRFYNIFVEGGDVQPQPKTEEEILKKKVISLDTSCSTFLRRIISQTLDLPYDRGPFENSLAEEPELLNALWEQELFSRVVAFLWRCTFKLSSGKSLSKVRVVTLRETASVAHLDSTLNGQLDPKEVNYLTYAKEKSWYRPRF